MDIDGFSESTACALIEHKQVREFSDLYRLTEDDLRSLDGFKDKKIRNLLSAIAKSKTPTLDAFIYAIGVDGVGRVAAKDLAKTFKSMERLKTATTEELVGMENIGEITANGITDYFADEDNLKELDNLFALGVTPICLTKARLKVRRVLKPTIREISVIDLSLSPRYLHAAETRKELI